MIGFSRTTQDSLTVTFGPTCRSWLASDFPQTTPPTRFSGALDYFTWDDKRITMTLSTFPSDFASKSFGSIPGSDSKPTQITVRSRDRDQPTRVLYAKVDWTWNRLSDTEFLIVGTFNNFFTKQTAGQIWLRAAWDSKKGEYVATVEHYPNDLPFVLDNARTTDDFWHSIPPCDALTPAQKSDLVTTVQSRNELLRLTLTPRGF